MAYVGGKNSGGVYHSIINQLPPHHIYIEPFAGSGAIARKKRPAELTILLDLDPHALVLLEQSFKRDGYVPTTSRTLRQKAYACCRPARGHDWIAFWSNAKLLKKSRAVHSTCEPWLVVLARFDAVRFLQEFEAPADALIYADPPYVLAATKTKRPRYRIAPRTAQDDEAFHRLLLNGLRQQRCPVALSGYRNPLYAAMLKDWRVIDFKGHTRRGCTTESLWCNFSEPVKLHDYRYLGDNRTARQVFKRSKTRLLSRLERMSPVKRYAVFAAIEEFLQTWKNK